jgi:hypothetical protein
MNIEEANAELDKIIEGSGDTVYCRAINDTHYTGKVVIRLDGDFTHSQLAHISGVALRVKQK